MTDFTTDVPTTSVADPRKRVRYSTGLVLGVDEFEQEQAYFIERDRLLTRALHGYGVVHGLDVRVDPSEPDLPKLVVGPGLAVDPCGQHVCVEQAQCAFLDDWLGRQDASAVIGGASEPAEVCVAVVLRYGTCATDFVPLAGGPCRSAEDARVASRVADDFHLSLEWLDDRPPHVEERAIRLLGRLLRAMEVHPSGPYPDREDYRRLVAALPDALAAADDSDGDVSLTDLAAATGTDEQAAVEVPTAEDGSPLFRVEPGQAAALLRLIEDTWVTAARPNVLALGTGPDPLDACGGSDCQPVPAGDDGVVLGVLCLQAATDASPDAGDEPGLRRTTPSDTLAVDTDRRPLLLATRVLQETRSGALDRVRPMPSGGGDGGDGGDGPPDISNIAAGGDLSGTYPNPSVARILGEPLSMTGTDEPVGGEVLTYDGTTWRPRPLPQPEIPDVPEPPPTNVEESLTRIVATNWTHRGVLETLDALDLKIVDGEPFTVRGVALAFGTQPVEPVEELKPGEEGAVLASTLTPETVRAFVEVPRSDFDTLVQRVRLRPIRVSALTTVQIEDQSIVGGETDANAGQARGVVLEFSDAINDIIGSAIDGRIEVEVRGDFILDPKRRAIDAEFPRATFPTGDRAEESPVGVQGGRFESWFFVNQGEFLDTPVPDLGGATLRDPTRFRIETEERIDLRSADVQTLTELPYVGETVAKNIVELRTKLEKENEPLTEEMLLKVNGLTKERLAEWQGRVKL